MRRSGPLGAVAALLMLAGAGAAVAQEPPWPEAFAQRLYEGRTEAAAALARDRLAQGPGDAQALYALGAAQFLQAVERLGQGLHRYGLDTRAEGPRAFDLPFLRLPVPPNPAPEPVSYAALRELLAQFVDDLSRAEATLAAVPPGPVALPVDLMRLRLDLDGDGTGTEAEGVAAILARLSGLSPTGPAMPVRFDESDVPWMQGYTHLLMAMAEMLLAHDFPQVVDLTLHGFFPASDLPGSALSRQAAEDRAFLAGRGTPAITDPRARSDRQAWLQTDEGRAFTDYWDRRNRVNYAGIAEMVAFAHLVRWPVVAPERMRSARGHLLSMIALSRETWVRIDAETDDDDEWLPGPHQTSPWPRMRVTPAIVSGWHDFLDAFEAVLEGRLLVPHWRFPRDRGVNVGRMFTDPQTFDLVLVVHGAGILPYLEQGQMAPGTTLDTAEDLLGEGYLAYFLWFN